MKIIIFQGDKILRLTDFSEIRKHWKSMLKRSTTICWIWRNLAAFSAGRITATVQDYTRMSGAVTSGKLIFAHAITAAGIAKLARRSKRI